MGSDLGVAGVNTNMATLRIEILYHGAWAIFNFQVQELIADRDRYLARLKRRLGSEMAEKIVQHVEVSCGRLLPLPEYRDGDIMTMPEFFELLALEKTLLDIKRRIEENSVFYDFHLELLTTLGISEQELQRLIDGQQSPGYLPVENVQKLTARCGCEAEGDWRSGRQEVLPAKAEGTGPISSKGGAGRRASVL